VFPYLSRADEFNGVPYLLRADEFKNL